MSLGLKSVSMDDIARKLGISKKTLYTVVANKHELISLVLSCEYDEDHEAMARHKMESGDAIDEYLKNSRYFIRGMREISPTTVYDLRKYYPDIWQEQMNAHQSSYIGSIQLNVERGMEEGLYRDDLEPEVIAHFYFGTMNVLMDRVRFPGTERPLADVISQHAAYHLNGIVNQFGRDRMEEYLKVESMG